MLNDTSITYCGTEINEYCRDSEHYLENLIKWKKSDIKEQIQITTSNVKNLYPSLKINLIRCHLKKV